MQTDDTGNADQISMMIIDLAGSLSLINCIEQVLSLDVKMMFGDSSIHSATLFVKLNEGHKFSKNDCEAIIKALQARVSTLRKEFVSIYDTDGRKLSAIAEDGTIPEMRKCY